MFRVAFYGKGGIGKSTVSSNTSFFLASRGRTVHVGCDPKHDSTRLLLPDGSQETVLDLVRKGVGDPDKISVVGKGGVLCIESGGPEPGIGCAGKGIITAFGIMRDARIMESNPDFLVYDVLGDVVCGGFAIPMRPDRSDGIVLVTSGEFMSLFACNNILRGILALSGTERRIVGIVANLRGGEAEVKMVSAFAEAVKLPVVSWIPRSRLVAECERMNEPLGVLFPDSDVCEAVRAVAEAIVSCSDDRQRMHPPCPLDEDGIAAIARGECPVSATMATVCTRGPISVGTVLETCSAAGAVDIGYYVSGVDILLHSPDSCAYIFSSFHDRMFSNDATDRILDFTPSGAKMYCTGLRDIDSIFGGVRILKSKLEEMIGNGSKDIMVVTTCLAGIIGDDVESVAREVESAHPGVTVTPVLSDGNMTGHMGEGLYMASTALLRYVRSDVQPDPAMVNILGMSFMKLSYKDKMSSMQGLLDLFGLKVNCMFVGGCDLEDIRNLRRGSMNIMMSNVGLARALGEEVEDRFGIRMFEASAPIGYGGTCAWITALGKELGKDVSAALNKLEMGYASIVSRYRPILEGVDVAMYYRAPRDVRWLCDLMNDLGMNIVYVAFGSNGSKRKSIPKAGCCNEMRIDCTEQSIMDSFVKDRVSLIVTDSESLKVLDCRFCGPMDGFLGIQGLESAASALSDAMVLNKTEEWRRDA